MTPPTAPDPSDPHALLAHAEQVFLRGNGLPTRWRGRTRFVILDTGFGLGPNFLAAWAAWRADAGRCERLHFIGIEPQPHSRADLARAHAGSALPDLAAQLVSVWPPLTPNLHGIQFEGGQVRLTLAFGAVRSVLRELVAEVDAFFVDGFAPACSPQTPDAYFFKSLARLAAPAATAATGSWAASAAESVPETLRDALSAAGFVVQPSNSLTGQAAMTPAHFAPRHPTQRPAGRQPLAAGAREAIVIGAGLAGAACAAALREQGVAVRVLERHAQAASEASGNPAGLFHGTVNAADGLHARFNRAAALATARQIARLQAAGHELPSLQRGLLRLETRLTLPQMQAQIEALGLPADYVQALSAPQTAAQSGLALHQPAWFYPDGGSLAPREYVSAMLTGSELRVGIDVAQLRSGGAGWQVLDARGQVLDEAQAVVLASGQHSARLLASACPGKTWPWQTQRGQLSHLPAALAAAWGLPAPRLPVAGAGYAIADGHGGLWCGATAQDEQDAAFADTALRLADHQHNLRQYAALAGLPAQAIEQIVLEDLNHGPALVPASRVAWRLMLPDRLPLCGGIAMPMLLAGARNDQLRLLPRLPGLAVCTALGSRGITWARLCGELVAAQMLGTPWPVEAKLAQALDPERFALRAASCQLEQAPSAPHAGFC